MALDADAVIIAVILALANLGSSRMLINRYKELVEKHEEILPKVSASLDAVIDGSKKVVQHLDDLYGKYDRLKDDIGDIREDLSEMRGEHKRNHQ